MRRLVLGLVMLMAPVTAMGQGTDNMADLLDGLVPNSEDIRSIGMGKTGVAGIEGPNALFTNPAALGAMDHAGVSVGGRVQAGLISDEEADADTNYTYSQYFTPHVKLMGLSIAAPFEIPNSPVKLGAGLGYHTAFDFGSNVYAERKSRKPLGGKTIINETTMKSSGGLNTITGGLSVGIMDKIFGGLSFNKSILGKMSRETEVEVNYPKDTTYTSEMYMKTSAFHLSFGAMVKPIPQLKIGLSYTPGFDWEADEVGYTQGNKDTTLDINEEISIPGLFSVGVEYQLLPQLKVAAEYQTRPYGEAELNNKKQSSKIDDGFCFRSGLEILAGIVPVRLGFFAESMPMTDQIYGKINKDPKTLLGVTGGIGIPVQNVVINLGLQYAHYSFDYKASTLNAKVYTRAEDHLRLDASLTFNFDAPKFTASAGAPAATQIPAATAPAPQPQQRYQPQTQPAATQQQPFVAPAEESLQPTVTPALTPEPVPATDTTGSSLTTQPAQY